MILLFVVLIHFSLQLEHCTFKSESESNYLRGEWIQTNETVDIVKKCPETILRHSKKYVCDERFVSKERIHSSSWKRGFYRAVDCLLDEFNLRQFLAQLDGKKIVFVGDSLMDQMFVALRCECESQGMQMNDFDAQFSMVWSEHLVKVDLTQTSHFHSRQNDFTLQSLLQRDENVHVVVANTGAWWNYLKLNYNVYDTSYLRALHQFNMMIEKTFRNGRLIWRDISPAGVASVDENNQIYNWHKFHRWNQMAREFFYRNGHHLLMIEELSLLRNNDSHLGCRPKHHSNDHQSNNNSTVGEICDYLHWCNPSASSVPEAWVKLLYNLIMFENDFELKASQLKRRREKNFDVKKG